MLLLVICKMPRPKTILIWLVLETVTSPPTMKKPMHLENLTKITLENFKNVRFKYKNFDNVFCRYHNTVIFVVPATSHKHNASILLCIFCKNLSLFVSYAVLMRPNKVETAVHGCLHSG